MITYRSWQGRFLVRLFRFLWIILFISNPHMYIGNHTCWHAAIYPAVSAIMATQCSSCELRSISTERFQLCMSGWADSTALTWNFCDSHPALSRGHPTDTHSIDLSRSKLSCVLWMHSTGVILVLSWFLPRWWYSAKVDFHDAKFFRCSCSNSSQNVWHWTRNACGIWGLYIVIVSNEQFVSHYGTYHITWNK